MRNILGRTLFALLLLSLLPTAVVAQTAPVEPSETRSRIETLAKAMGPVLGPLAYEPRFVLFAANLSPEISLYHKSIATSPPDLDALNRAAARFDIKFTLEPGDNTIRGRSLNGLAWQSTNNPAVGLAAFDPKSSWSGYEEWEQKFRSSEPDRERSGLRWSYYKEGLPISAVDSIAGTVPHLRRWTVEANVPYIDRLESSEQLRLITMPIAVDESDFVATSRQWAGVLKGFYTQPTVRTLLSSPEFVAARTNLYSNTYDSPAESWGRGLGNHSVFPRPAYDVTDVHERILKTHIDEVTAMLGAGATTPELFEALNRWAAQVTPATTFTGDIFEKCCWSGAVDVAPWRRKLYQEVKAQNPRYLEALAGIYFERGLKELSESSPYPNAVLAVFDHPEIKALFLTLPQAKRTATLRGLEKLSSDNTVRTLLGQAPYQ